MIFFLLYIKVYAKILFFVYWQSNSFFTYLYNGISYCYEIEHMSP